MPDCEVCGAPSEELYIVSVEGARLTVCERCKPPGKILGMVGEARPRAVVAAPQPRPLPEDTDPGLVDNLGAAVRSARESKGWSQEELAQKVAEQVGIVRKIETGRTDPTEKAARKIEKALGVSLHKGKAEKPLLPQKPKKAGELITLGDIVTIRNK